MRNHLPLFLLLLSLLSAGAPSPEPPGTARLLEKALARTGAPAGLLERWKKPFLARLKASRARGFLVRPPIAPNRFCRDFQESPFQGVGLARKVTGRVARLFGGARTAPSLLEALGRLTRRGKSALEDHPAGESPLPPPTRQGLETLLSGLHRAWTKGPGTWKKGKKAFPGLKRITDRFIQNIYIHAGLSPAKTGPIAALLATASRGDSSALHGAAGRLLQALLDGKWRKDLATNLSSLPQTKGKDGVTGSVLGDWNLPFGRLVAGGPGRNTYDCRKIPFIVDLGGDDTYLGPAGGAAGPDRPLSLVLDLGGNDAYRCKEGGQGSGILGAGILVDTGGDDSYQGGRRCQGFALCGVGILADLAGDDTYQGHELSQGSAFFGTGLLLDLSGKDTYTAWLYAQGFGGAGGAGVLADKAGNDRYTAGNHYPSYYPEDAKRGECNAMSQGVAVGFRGIADGGVGILLDGRGDDFHRVGQFSCGGAYFFGVGIVRDLSGNDEYQVGRYGGAFAPHQAVGVLLDDAGDDVYAGRGTACLAGTWDTSLAFLVDGGGNDSYTGVGITLGGATICSFSLFLDLAGSDSYRVMGGDRTALGSGGHPQDLKFRTFSLGAFLDLGKGRDRFSFTGRPLHPRLPGKAAWWEVKLGKEKKTAGFGLFADWEK